MGHRLPDNDVSQLYLNVASDRTSENTSKALECGFVEIEWVPLDFTKMMFSKGNGWLCSTFKRFRSKAFFSVLAGPVMVIFAAMRFRSGL